MLENQEFAHGLPRGVDAQIRESRRVFVEHVWPYWAERCSAAKLISTEGSERRLEREADFSGTDAFLGRHRSGVLVPLASRVEYFDAEKNNPFSERYWDHYPRFTIRLAKARPDGSLIMNVECRKRLLALEDPVSRRYLPLYTFQSLVRRNPTNYDVLQTSRVRTDELFDFVKARGLADLSKGMPSRTRAERDVYRIVTVEKLSKAGITVDTFDCRSLIR